MDGFRDQLGPGPGLTSYQDAAIRYCDSWHANQNAMEGLRGIDKILVRLRASNTQLKIADTNEFCAESGLASFIRVHGLASRCCLGLYRLPYYNTGSRWKE